MSLGNATDYAALAAAYLSPSGEDVVATVVKATFERRERGLVLAEEQRAVRLAPVAHDPSAADGSLRYPEDLGAPKRGVDLVIVGEAVARGRAQVVEVTARIGAATARLRVFGERVYYRSSTGLAIGEAAPFERKPIIYERAFGGRRPDGALEMRNPIGRGFDPRADEPAPQIEDPERPSTPAGFGVVSAHWAPRCFYFGTADETWRRERMPLWPLDYDPRFNNVAHPTLQLDALPAGAPIGITGMTEAELFAFEMPETTVKLTGHYDDRVVEAAPLVDTVLIEPSLGVVELTMRHAFPMGRGKRMLREIRVNHG